MQSTLEKPRYVRLDTEEAEADLREEDYAIGDALSIGALAKGQSTWKFSYIAFLLAASLTANFILFTAFYKIKVSQSSCQQLSQPTCPPCSQPVSQQSSLTKSPYGMDWTLLDRLSVTNATLAGLEYNIDGSWESESPYAQDNITAADEEWMAVDISNGFVALTKEHAKDLGLPPSLRFPWDQQHKELYLLTSIHSVHCLIRLSSLLVMLPC